MAKLSRNVRCWLLLLSTLACGIGGLSSSVFAIEVADLYQAKVAVTDQSEQARRAAQREALKKVMVKVSGNGQILINPQIIQAIDNAASYLSQFQFIRNDQNKWELEANFDQSKINRLLRQEGLPIWGKRRPAILLWMAGEDPQSAIRKVVSKESYGQQIQQIQQVSKDRGLPIIMPLYDLEDNKSVSVSDVWGHFYDHISQFSYRYKTDAIAIARFWQEPFNTELETTNELNWKLEWRLYETDKLVDVQTLEGELATILANMVNLMADRYAAHYAVDSQNLETAPRIVITIRNVLQIERLIKAEKLLQSFSAVADVLLINLNQDVAVFEIKLIGAPLDLLLGMELEERFEKIYDPLASKALEQPLEFRWVP